MIAHRPTVFHSGPGNKCGLFWADDVGFFLGVGRGTRKKRGFCGDPRKRAEGELLGKGRGRIYCCVSVQYVPHHLRIVATALLCGGCMHSPASPIIYLLILLIGNSQEVSFSRCVASLFCARMFFCPCCSTRRSIRSTPYFYRRASTAFWPATPTREQPWFAPI